MLEAARGLAPCFRLSPGWSRLGNLATLPFSSRRGTQAKVNSFSAGRDASFPQQFQPLRFGMFLNVKIALQSLSVHKVRTILAMLGIFLGALAFTGVQHVSRIMVRNAEMEVEKMGPNLFAVMSGQIRFRHSGSVRFSGATRTFSVSDARALATQVPSVLDYTPLTSVTGTLRAGAVATDANMIGCWPSYQKIRSFYPSRGRFFTEDEVRDAARVCVLGSEIAQRLFGGAAQAIGQNVFYYRASFRVVGVMESKGTDLSGTNQDEQVFLPLSTYMRRAANQDWVLGAYLHLADGADLSLVKDAVRSVLRRRHHIVQGKADDFSLLEPKETIQLQRQALDLMWTLGIISSTISFAVGGLGILSIMILMVRTRRLEIGVRRAVGATRGDIVLQFVSEAALLSFCGGALGVLLCVLLIVGFAAVSGYPLILDPVLLLATLAGSALLGIASGAYPAWQAARVEILDVLKSEA